MTPKETTRRRMLAFAATSTIFGTVGCLRLTGEQTTMPSDQRTVVSTQDGTTVSSDEGTKTPSENVTATPLSEVTLTKSWQTDDLWEVFDYGDRIAGERPSQNGGSVVFVDSDGNVEYASDEIGGDYVLELKQGDALASGPSSVFAAGRDVSSSGTTARLAAFGSDSGDQRWTHETKPSGTESRIPSLTADDDRVYYAAVGDGSSRDQEAVVRAVDTVNGTVDWEHVVGEDFIRGVAKYGSRLFVGRSQQLVLLDAATGTVETRVDLGTSAFSGMVQSDERLFVADSRIRAYDLETGEELWSVNRDREPDSAVTVAGNVLFAGTDAGYVTAHDLNDGSKRWETRTGQSIATKPAANDDVVFVGDSIGSISAIDRSSGSVVYEGQHFTERPERTTLAATESVVCFSGLTTDAVVSQGFEIS